MFSSNEKISGRQAFRLLVFDLLGLGTLLIPTAVAGFCGRDGIFCIIAGTVAGILFLKLMVYAVGDMQGSFAEYTVNMCGTFFGKIIQAGYFLYLVLLAGYTAYLFSVTVLNNLLRGESFYLVLVLILGLVWYGLLSGIEGRARVYELLFWIILIPLFIMLASALDEVKTDYWNPVFFTERSDFFAGSVYLFISYFSCFVSGRVSAKTGKPDESRTPRIDFHRLPGGRTLSDPAWSVWRCGTLRHADSGDHTDEYDQNYRWIFKKGRCIYVWNLVLYVVCIVK